MNTTGTFYNTIHLKGDELATARDRAATQGVILGAIFRRHKALTPSQAAAIAEDMGHPWLITSVRRAITTLTERGVLHKTPEKVKGPNKKPEHIWRAA